MQGGGSASAIGDTVRALGDATKTVAEAAVNTGLTAAGGSLQLSGQILKAIGNASAAGIRKVRGSTCERELEEFSRHQSIVSHLVDEYLKHPEISPIIADMKKEGVTMSDVTPNATSEAGKKFYQRFEEARDKHPLLRSYENDITDQLKGMAAARDQVAMQPEDKSAEKGRTLEVMSTKADETAEKLGELPGGKDNNRFAKMMDSIKDSIKNIFEGIKNFLGRGRDSGPSPS